MATRKEREDAIKIVLDPNAMWSDDPAKLLYELLGSAQTTLDKLLVMHPGAKHSQEFWQFVAEESLKLSISIQKKWKS